MIQRPGRATFVLGALRPMEDGEEERALASMVTAIDRYEFEDVLLSMEGGDTPVDIVCGNAETALTKAAGCGETDCCAVLLDLGADIDHVNCFQRTALMKAAGAGHTDTVGLLLEVGADAFMRDCKAKTALDWARLSHHAPVVDVLEGYIAAEIGERRRARNSVERLKSLTELLDVNR